MMTTYVHLDEESTCSIDKTTNTGDSHFITVKCGENQVTIFGTIEQFRLFSRTILRYAYKEQWKTEGWGE